jgi:hypothetical protein
VGFLDSFYEAASAAPPTSEWEDRGIFVVNRRTGEKRLKGIAGGLPTLPTPVGAPEAGQLEAARSRLDTMRREGDVTPEEIPGPVSSYLSTVGETYRGVPVRIKEGIAAIPELAETGLNFLIPSSPQGRLQIPKGAIYGEEGGLVRETRESVREGYREAQDKLSDAARGLPPWMAGAAEVSSEVASAVVDPTNALGAGLGAKALAKQAPRQLARELPEGIAELASRSLETADAAAAKLPAEGLRLRGAPDQSVEEGLERLLSLPAGPVSADDLPFDLVDLPLTRWHLKRQRPEAIRGVEFFTIGDTTHYTQSASAGGSNLKAETFTPENPLVVNGGASGAAKAMGLAAREADFNVAEQALVDYARKRGHDSIVTLHPGDNDLQVIKLPGAKPGAPRSSPYLETYASGLAPGGWQQYMSPEELASPLLQKQGEPGTGGFGPVMFQYKVRRLAEERFGVPPAPKKFASYAERTAYWQDALARIPDDGSPEATLARGWAREQMGIAGMGRTPRQPAASVADAMSHAGSDVSPEALSRMAGGNRYFRIGPGGEATPILADAGAVDVRVNPGEVKVLVTASGDKVVEQGRLNPFQQRALDELRPEPPRDISPETFDLPEEGDDVLSALGVERVPGAPGGPISSRPVSPGLPAPSRAPQGVPAPKKVNPEAGFIRLGPGKPADAPDSVLGAFHGKVFGREAEASKGERLQAFAERMENELVEAYAPTLRVARRFGPEVEDAVEVGLQRVRNAAHAQMQPVTRFTEEWVPEANGGRGDWLKTGEPLTAVTDRLARHERVEFESILAAGSQLEFAGRKAAAAAAWQADRVAIRAEKNMLRLLGQEQRRELRGLSYEARSLRAEELRGARRAAKATGNLEVLERLRRAALGSRIPLQPGGRMPALEARAWAADLEQGAAAAAAKDTEGALRRGITELSVDELKRYREQLRLRSAPRPQDLRLKVDPKMTDEARQVWEHAERSGLLKKYEEALGQASLDRSAPGTGYRGWADRAWLRPAVASGMMKESERIAMLQKNQMYSLFQQIDTLARSRGVDLAAGEQAFIPRFLKRAPEIAKGGIRKSPISARMAGLQEGSQIAPVLEASAVQAARFQRIADRQWVKNKLASLAEESPELVPELVRSKDPMAPGSFVQFKDGERQFWQAPEDLLENLDRLTAKQAAAVLDVAAAATRMLKVGATTFSPHFPTVNALRDAQRSWLTSKHGMLPFEPQIELAKELVHRLVHKGVPSPAWKEFDESIASYSNFIKADSVSVNRAMEESREAIVGRPSVKKILDVVNPIEWARKYAAFTEAASRVTEMRLAQKGGRPWFRGQADPSLARDPSTGKVLPRTRSQAGLDAAKVTLNFQAGGKVSRAANRYWGFFNVAMLDNVDFFRQVLGPRKFTVIAKATAGLTIPALYEAWHYRDDPDYQNLHEWDKALFWHVGKFGEAVPEGSEVLPDGRIRTPSGEIREKPGVGNGWWRRVPKPVGLFNLVFSYLPQKGLEMLLQNNPDAAEAALGGLVEQTPLNLFLDYDEPAHGFGVNLFPTVPDVLRPPLEAGLNRKGFPFGQPIDPRGLEEADPAVRYDEFSPEWAKRASELSAPGPYHGSVSPNRIQRVVEGYTAGMGQTAGLVADKTLLSGADPNGDLRPDSGRPVTPRDVPFARAFASPRPVGPGSLPVQELWATYDRARATDKAIEGWDNAGRSDQAMKAYEAHPELRYLPDLESAAEKLKALGKERKELVAVPFHLMGEEQKRGLVELLDQAMQQEAGRVLLYIQQEEAMRKKTP